MGKPPVRPMSSPKEQHEPLGVESGRAITALDQFRFVRDEIKHEYNVLGSRLSSYIASQSFLFAAYGVSMSNPDKNWGPTFRLLFPLIVCVVGILTSVRAQPGIVSASQILDYLHERQFKLYASPEVAELDPSDPKWMRDVHQQSLKFALVSAYIFGGAWIALVMLAAWVFFSTPR
jgi:hypothetical protein